MAEMVLMPQKGVSDESALLAQWLVKEGDTVRKDQIIFTQETGKSSFECECPADGVVLKIFAKEGDEIKVGEPVCAIGKPGEKVDVPAASAAAPAAAPAAEEKAAAPVAAAAPAAATAAPAPAADGFVKASPRARMLAEQTGAALGSAVPTGPDGRIIERDVRTLLNNGPVEAAAPAASVPAAAASAPAAEFEDKPLTKIRKIIAENMHKSLSEMAQLTLNRSFDATAIMAFRKVAKNSQGYGLEGVTLNDFILYAVARTLPEFPELNANLLGDKMRYFKHVDLGVAVDTPRGLMVPVLRHADTMSLAEISAAVKAKAAQCKAGNIPPSELTGGSFTVSNLGASGIESFTPVINPPQTAILGVDTFTLRPKDVNGEIKFYQAMGLSLTIDHRAVDGAPGAQFLKKLSERLENFQLLLAM